MIPPTPSIQEVHERITDPNVPDRTRTPDIGTPNRISDPDAHDGTTHPDVLDWATTRQTLASDQTSDPGTQIGPRLSGTQSDQSILTSDLGDVSQTVTPSGSLI